MAPEFRQLRSKPLLVGVLASLLGALLIYTLPRGALETPRELFFDTLTQSVPAPERDGLLVVDIDHRSFQSVAGGEWQRAQTAELITALAAAKPVGLALDLVFSGNCDATDPANRALADAIGGVPAVLGFLIGDRPLPTPRPVPGLAVQRPVDVPASWFVDGTETSCPMFQDRAAAAASAFLVGDADALVRRVQAYSIVDNAAYPALGVEVARRAAGAGTPVLGGTPAWIRQDTRILHPDESGSLRFVAADAARIARRTASAVDVLRGVIAPERIAGRMVLIGSSMPALGGLRASASMPLEPSVQIHADLATAILTGFVPTRDQRLIVWEAAFALLAGIGIAFSITRLRPMPAAALGLVLLVATIAAAALIYRQTALLVDAVSIVLALTSVLLVTGILQFSQVRRAEQTARQRFAQYLPESVVSRYLDNPGLDRVAGEERQVTALFTDIEGFSALSHRIGPQRLVPLLDIYFREVNALVERQGGMVNKIVGDAVTALFNAPDDLDRHVDKAIGCAVAIHDLTEEMRRRPPFAAAAFGRTRIGIETGLVVLGEVGTGGRLDYTAHGEAMNVAARLQEENKMLGTDICIGPAAAAQTSRLLRSLGRREIRGIGSMELFTPDAPQ
ncbi:adenylate cyclase [Mycoplana sp. BE70]|uniref:CHASE2 domain-containing protein n=1 Tax=Mycoplana sp. BE70 TaxID=2817775 RepID=UPI002856A61C|nr:CHASE2 domain-containing protein [Mycoplana sp. BE70]MDR6755000.1 adenylate cyclase [Mycoplana sp. BE70]